MVYFKIDGTDIAPYIADGGLSWENNDIDSDDSGRTMDSKMYRTALADKDKYTITCRPLKKAESMLIINLLKGHTFVTVSTNLTPSNASISKEMYNSARKNTLRTVYNQTDDLWEGLSFSLIER